MNWLGFSLLALGLWGRFGHRYPGKLWSKIVAVSGILKPKVAPRAHRTRLRHPLPDLRFPPLPIG